MLGCLAWKRRSGYGCRIGTGVVSERGCGYSPSGTGRNIPVEVLMQGGGGLADLSPPLRLAFSLRPFFASLPVRLSRRPTRMAWSVPRITVAAAAKFGTGGVGLWFTERSGVSAVPLADARGSEGLAGAVLRNEVGKTGWRRRGVVFLGWWAAKNGESRRKSAGEMALPGWICGVDGAPGRSEGRIWGNLDGVVPDAGAF
jgi:hypothetical protein